MPCLTRTDTIKLAENLVVAAPSVFDSTDSQMPESSAVATGAVPTGLPATEPSCDAPSREVQSCEAPSEKFLRRLYQPLVMPRAPQGVRLERCMEDSTGDNSCVELYVATIAACTITMTTSTAQSLTTHLQGMSSLALRAVRAT